MPQRSQQSSNHELSERSDIAGQLAKTETGNPNDALQKQVQNQALDSLRLESQLHQQQIAQRGLIGAAVTGVTELFHGSSKSGQRVDALANDLSESIKSGDKQRTRQLENEAEKAIIADRKALGTAATVDQVSSGLIKSVGLFVPGKVGYAITATTAALDSVKPYSGETLAATATDIALGVSKGVGMKATFDYAASHNWGVAGSAVGLGVASRLSDVALTRSTYQDQKGNFSAELGASRVFAASTDVSAIASDTVSFVVARGALGKLGANNLVSENKVLNAVVSGGIFGVTKGSSDEVIRQTKAGVFEPGKFAEHVLTSAGTNMLGAALGARIGQIQSARNNFDGATSREYQIVGKVAPIAALMSQSRTAEALTTVREVKARGELGPEQTMLVQHNDGAFTSKLAGKADLLATCNPNSLPDHLQVKHILASAQELWLTQAGNRLRFSSDSKAGIKPGIFSLTPEPVALGANPAPSLAEMLAKKQGQLPEQVDFDFRKIVGRANDQLHMLPDRTVASILRDANTRDMLRHKDTHDLGLYADVLRDFKIPGKRVIDGGADSVVIELSNSQILKVTNQTWNSAWGTRTFSDAQGIPHRFDAKIIGTPTLTDGPYGPANYYLQERVVTPVSKESMDRFAANLDRDRKYTFWDRDESQLGYVDLGAGKRALVLIDYDAVRQPHLVEKNLKKRWSE